MLPFLPFNVNWCGIRFFILIQHTLQHTRRLKFNSTMEPVGPINT